MINLLDYTSSSEWELRHLARRAGGFRWSGVINQERKRGMTSLYVHTFWTLNCPQLSVGGFPVDRFKVTFIAPAGFDAVHLRAVCESVTVTSSRVDILSWEHYIFVQYSHSVKDLGVVQHLIGEMINRRFGTRFKFLSSIPLFPFRFC